jgi:leucyl aminopeptidase
MTITFTASRSIPKAAKAAVTIVTSDAVDAGIAGVDPDQLKAAGFEGKVGQTHRWPSDGRVSALVGIGAAADVDTNAVRAAGASIGRGFGRHPRVGVALPESDLAAGEARQALAEGLTLSTYTYTTYKSDAKPTKLTKVDVAGASGARAQAAIDRGAVLAAGQCFARDLVNEPGGDLTPAAFARRLSTMAKSAGLTVKVWDEAAIKKGKLGGILGVNRGSTNPPRLVELTYTPKGKATGTLALVGKGITFDSGGLSIKTLAGMMTMKCDMGGGAAVAGAMSVLGALGATAKVRAFIPMTDNMTGGDATRPGDVLKIRNGKTIEVLNTDAEGRLVLADGLSLASEMKPDAIIDMATLTGACMVALGPKIAGLMGNNDDWISQIESASATTGERVWHLPLPADYKKQFEAPVADMKNTGTPHDGALTAGLILQEFVADGIAWAHVDIAGPAWSDVDDGEITRGGTGFGVRLLADLATNFTRP